MSVVSGGCSECRSGGYIVSVVSGGCSECSEWWVYSECSEWLV